MKTPFVAFRRTAALLAAAGLAAQCRDVKNSAVIYLLLGAASRRFGGNSAVDQRACRNLAASSQVSGANPKPH